MNEIPQVRIDKDADVLLLTVGVYKLFLANGRPGLEAMELYLHLMFTARLQESNQIKANDAYLRKGLSVGTKKLRTLKSFLHRLGLIEYVRRRDTDGRILETFIRVKLWSRESLDKITTGAKITPMDNTGNSCPLRAKNDTGGSEKQMLKEKKRKESGEEISPLHSWKTALSECRNAYRVKYGVGLQIMKDATVKAFREVGISEADIVAAYKLYLADTAEFLARETHPWRTFLSQLSTYAAKAKGGPVKVKARHCKACGEIEMSTSAICTGCGGELEVRKNAI